MVECTFELNGQPMSEFKCWSRSFPAFSGLSPYINKRAYACAADLGPIPPGTYYIIDRPTGGTFGAIRDTIYRRKDWFALYADDGKIDDITFCNQVERGKFRLHPKGPYGISFGCVVIDDAHDFLTLRSMLKSTSMGKTPSTSKPTYGRLIVR